MSSSENPPGRLLAKVDLTKALVIFMGDNGTPANLKESGSAAGERVSGNSVSLQPLLTGSAASTGRTHAFTELCQPGVSRDAIRDGRYKLSYDTGVWGLFDLTNDRGEANNLYAWAAVATNRASLETELSKIRAAATAGCFQ